MEYSQQLRDALQRLQRLCPASSTPAVAPTRSDWLDEGRSVELLEGAIDRSGWTVLKERYGARLKALREESPQPFESTKETVTLQCRAFHEVMDEFDRTRRAAVARSERRTTGGTA
ncbi:MAG: hypothetical protein JNK85_24805 [Verrucomicrobiales bacterium]|nr:hypothetical protein [Verrucomicrobiales bacterium]